MRQVQAEAVEVASRSAASLRPTDCREPLPKSRRSPIIASVSAGGAAYRRARQRRALCRRQQKLDEIARARGFDGRLVVMAEADIAPGDCRIEWGRRRPQARARPKPQSPRQSDAISRRAAAAPPCREFGRRTMADPTRSCFSISPPRRASPRRCCSGGHRRDDRAAPSISKQCSTFRCRFRPARPRLHGRRRIAQSGPGTVLELDRKVGEAIDIYVNNRLVARRGGPGRGQARRHHDGNHQVGPN